MVGGSESMAIASMWASMTAWFTPTMLFCIMNLIIGTIFIASKSNDTKQNDQVHPNSFRPIARVSSFLERARSVNLPSYTTIITTAAESLQQYPSKTKTATYSSLSRLAQSIFLSSSHAASPEFSNGEKMSQSESERNPDRGQSHLERVKSVKFSSVYSDENTSQIQADQTSNSPGQLVRYPSFLDRVKSFNVASAFKSGDPTPQLENIGTNTGHGSDHHVIKSKSEKSSAKKPVVEIKKSFSEIRIASDDEDEDVDYRRPATARAVRNADDDEFDAKADDFISRFKQNLKLQRLESLVRFRDMINRGT